jgi:pimeloyl-ACP methyl ester carboxylesterase
MAGWPVGEITINNKTFVYTRTGGNKPPIVLVHGFTDDRLCWTRLARDLEKWFDVVMPDSYGHGSSCRVGSNVPSFGIGVPDLADDLASIMRALDLERPAVVGHSMGATMAAHAVARHPGLFRAAILEDPPWYFATKDLGEQAKGYKEWYDLLAGQREAPREALITAKRDEEPSWHPLDIETYVDSRQRVDLALFWTMDWGTNTAWAELVPKIPVPTLLIYGEPDKGGIVTPEVAREVARLNDQIKLKQIAGVGHHIHRGQYAVFLETVNNFLALFYGEEFG